MPFSKAQSGSTPNLKHMSFGSFILALLSATKYHQDWEFQFMPSALLSQVVTKVLVPTMKIFDGSFCLPGESVSDTENSSFGDVSQSSSLSCACKCFQFIHKSTSSAVSVVHSCLPKTKSLKQSEISPAIDGHRCDSIKKLN